MFFGDKVPPGTAAQKERKEKKEREENQKERREEEVKMGPEGGKVISKIEGENRQRERETCIDSSNV